MSTAAIIDGVRFADPAMVELVRQAMEQGFRFEAGTNNRHATETGFTLYPPDTTHPPIRAGCGESSPRHLANIRRTLIRAGFIDKETDVSRQQKQQKPPVGYDISEMPEEDRASFASFVIQRLAEECGLPVDLAALLAMMLPLLEVHRDERGNLLVDPAELEQARAEVDAALVMAQQAEERARIAERHLETAKKDAGLLAERVKDTEARLEESKAEVRKLHAVLDPLKALIGSEA